jgi:hypothetical protein
MAGEVKWAENRYHTMRFKTSSRRSAGNFSFHRGAALVMGLRGHADLARDCVNFGEGLPVRLTGLHANGLGHFLSVRLNLFSKRLQISDSILESSVGP